MGCTNKAANKGGGVLHAYESGPESDPAEDELLAGVGGRVFDGLDRRGVRVPPARELVPVAADAGDLVAALALDGQARRGPGPRPPSPAAATLGLSCGVRGRSQPAPAARFIPAGRLPTRPRRVEAAAGDVDGRRVVLDAIFVAPPCAVPGSRDNRIMSNSESEFTLKDGALRFNGEARSFRATVGGPIINPQTQPSLRVQDWKEKVTRAVKDERGGAQWSPEHLYAVTLQFRICRHENQKLDVDNYVKPVLDGLAKGLGVDDSRFRILLIRRLHDDTEPEEVRLFVSSTEPDAGLS